MTNEPAVSPVPPIAVVGLGAMFPGGAGLRTFWRHVVAGDDLIGDVPATHWLAEDYFDPEPMVKDKVYSRRGAFLEPLDFDPREFGIVPTALPTTDPTQLLGLVVAKQALADAQGCLGDLDRDRVSVILGVATATQLGVQMAGRLHRPAWVKALREQGLPEDQIEPICDRILASFPEWQETTFPGLLNNVVAGRIANRLDLGGTNCVVDAACASSLAALGMAIHELHLGHADAVLTGGIDLLNDVLMYLCFSQTRALSRSDDCRPFSTQADGTLLGEGVGMLVLRRLEDAERDGNRIYAVIRGCGTSSDGRAKSIYAPRAEGQVKAYLRAYQQAGYGPETVELVEAHGTGTVAGDAAEIASLHQVFQGSDGRRPRWCALGSIKSQIGHAKGAAGAAGMLKAVLALQQGILPPTLKVDAPCAELRDETSPFYLNTRARPWVRSGEHPRRAAVSSFGFGGTNFHVTLEEYRGPGRAARLRTVPSEAILIGGEDPPSAAARCRELAAHPAAPGWLEYLAYSTQRDWRLDWPVRVVVVAGDAAELSARLLAAADRLSSLVDDGSAQEMAVAEGVYLGWRAEPGRIAFLFPGQGSQYLNMGAELAMFRPEAAAAWDLAAGSDAEGAPRLHERVFPPPLSLASSLSPEERRGQESALRQTEWAQPALGAVSLAALRVLSSAGIAPEMAAGHSFGEVVALHAAGVLSAEGMLQVARARGHHMAAVAGAAGAMTAVHRVPGDPAWEARLRGWLEEIGECLVIANDNSPQQVVLSGPLAAITAAERRLSAAGIRFVRLPVSTAFHSPLMAAAVGPFAAALEEVCFDTARLPVIAGSTAEPFPDDPGALRKLLAEQLIRPVRFADQVERLYAMGARTFVEVGVGAVLTPLVGACLGGRPHRAASIDRKGAHGVTALWELLARLTAAGVPMRWGALWEGLAVPDDPRALRRSPGTVSLNGALYGKPYPPPGGAEALPGPNPPTSSVPPAVSPGEEIARSTRIAAPAPLPGTASSTFGLNARVGEIEESMSLQTTDGTLWNGQERQEQERIAAAALDPATEQTPAWEAVSSAPTLNSSSRGQRDSWSEADPPTAHGLPIEDELPVGPSGGDPTTVEILAQVQLAFQENMLAGHLEFLRTVEALARPASGGDAAPRPRLDRMSRPPVRTLPAGPAPRAGAAPPVPAPAFPGESLPEPAGRRGRVDEAGAAAPGRQEAEDEPVPAPVGTRARVEPQARSAPLPDAIAELTKEAIMEILLEAVVAATGYPREVLAMEMDLEGELGIDSIKRVEILAAIQSRLPHLPELPIERLASLSTLSEIVAFIEEQRGYAEAPAAVPFPDGGAEGAGEARDPILVRSPRSDGGLPVDAEPLESRHGLRPEPEAACGFAAAGLLAGPIGITDDGRGIAAALAAELSRRGLPATIVDGLQPSAGVSSVVLLEGLRRFPAPADAAACHRTVFQIVRGLGAQLAQSGGVLAVVQDTGGRFGLVGGGPSAWAGGLSALAKTAAAEWPSLTARSLDVGCAGRDPAVIAAALAEELLRGGDDPDVGLAADGTRSVLRAVPCAVRRDRFWLDEGDVVLAIGGGRGVTAACLEELARHRRLRFALTGRTRLQEDPPGLEAISEEAGLIGSLVAQARARGETLSPPEARRHAQQILANREVRGTLSRLAAAGSEAIYLSGDVRDGAAMAAAVAEIRGRWGGIQGVIHGAGVLADKRILDKTDEQFDRVFGTKVDGLLAALAALEEEPLKCLVLFSSVASRIRNPGQCDYAMANEVLNQVALAESRRRGPSCRVRSIAWGPWDSGMVTPEVRQVFEKRGVPLLTTEQGARMFVEELIDAPGGEVVAVLWTPGPSETMRALRRAPSGPHPFLEGEPTAATAAPARFPVFIGAQSYPYLRDHSIRGVPVLPAALTAEWFARAVTRAYPEQRLAELVDFRVLRGVPLPEFGVTEVGLIVVVEPGAGGGSVRLELRDAAGQARYAAQGRLIPAGETAPVPAWIVSRVAGTAAGRRSLSPEEAYAGRLFHGPEFRVIGGGISMSSDGGSAPLEGVGRRAWPGPWRIDVAALDGCLQLPVLWGHLHLGQESLPTAIERLVFCADAPAVGALSCRFHVERRPGGWRADVLLTGPEERPLIAMAGAELTVLPARASATMPP